MADPDFDRIFAEGGAKDVITGVDYDGGWDDIAGALPPTKEEFNALQNESDLKAKYLYDRLEPHQNLLINGGFDINSRLQSNYTWTPAAVDKYCLDRWVMVKPSTAGNNFVAGFNFLAGYGNTLQTATTAGANPAAIAQRVTGLQYLAGREVTISFDARTTIPQNIEVEVTTTLAGVIQTPQVVTVALTSNTMGADRHSATFTVDNSVGTGVQNDFLSVGFIFPEDGSIIDWGKMKMEFGSVSTPFEPVPVAETRLVCAHFFQQAGSIVNIIAGDGYYAVGFGAGAVGGFSYPVEMIRTPTLLIFGTATATNNFITRGSDNVEIAVTIFGNSPRGFNGLAGGFNNMYAYSYTWEADAELY